MKKKILATTNDSGAAKAMYSVLNTLNQNQSLEVITLSEGPSQIVFKSKSVPYKTLKDYGINDDPESAEYLFKREKPDLVFTGISEFFNMERYLLYFARTNKIHSISVFEGHDYQSVRLKDEKIDPNYKFRPNYLLLIDDIVVDLMLKEGFKREQLIVTGHPGYDDILKLKQSFTLEDALRVREELNINQDAYLMIFLSQPRFESIKKDPAEDNGYTELTVLSDLEDALVSLDMENLFLLVKIHPREDINLTKTALKGKLRNVLFDKGYNTQCAMLTSNLVSGMFSLSLMEAVYLDKDTISLQPGLTKEDRLITNKLELTIPVYRKEDILPTLEKVVHDEEFKKQLRERRAKLNLDGKSTERVVNFVYSLLNI